VECPNTGQQIPLFPKQPKIGVVAAPFDCPVCGEKHVASYPPPRIK